MNNTPITINAADLVLAHVPARLRGFEGGVRPAKGLSKVNLC